MEKLLRKTLENGRFNAVPPIRSKMMGAIKGKGNKSTEMLFRHALIQAGIIGWTTQENIVGSPDIYFPFYKLAVFLDGCFWHGCPHCGHIPKTNSQYWQVKLERTKERDAKKTRALIAQGIAVLRFWEHDLYASIDHCITVLEDVLDRNLQKMVENS